MLTEINSRTKGQGYLLRTFQYDLRGSLVN